MHVAFTDDAGNLAFVKAKDPSIHNWFGLALSLRGVQIYPRWQTVILHIAALIKILFFTLAVSHSCHCHALLQLRPYRT